MSAEGGEKVEEEGTVGCGHCGDGLRLEGVAAACVGRVVQQGLSVNYVALRSVGHLVCMRKKGSTHEKYLNEAFERMTGVRSRRLGNLMSSR